MSLPDLVITYFNSGFSPRAQGYYCLDLHILSAPHFKTFPEFLHTLTLFVLKLVVLIYFQSLAFLSKLNNSGKKHFTS